MNIYVSDPEIAALLRAQGMGWGGRGRALYMPDPSVPSVKPAIHMAWTNAKVLAKLLWSGVLALGSLLRKEAGHGAA